MSKLKIRYNSTIRGELKKELDKKNISQVPGLEKVIINTGIGTYVAKVSSDFSLITDTLTQIAGQAPVVINAKVSVSNFNKLKVGQPNGLMVTLRREKMYDFIDKFINIALPRSRDFQGLSNKSFDGKGNYSVGLTDHTIFPEIEVADAVKPYGMQITIVTSATSDEEGKILLSKLGFPFKKK